MKKRTGGARGVLPPTGWPVLGVVGSAECPSRAGVAVVFAVPASPATAAAAAAAAGLVAAELEVAPPTRTAVTTVAFADAINSTAVMNAVTAAVATAARQVRIEQGYVLCEVVS